MERLMFFFTFSFFSAYNFMYSASNQYLYQPVLFLFVGVVTLFLSWAEVPKLKFRLTKLKQLFAFGMSYLCNLFIILFVTNFGFAFYHRIDFESRQFFMVFYSLFISFFHFIGGPLLIAIAQQRIIRFILRFLEEFVINEISKLNRKLFEEAKHQYAPRLSFRSLCDPMEVFEPDQMYLYGAHHLFYKFRKQTVKVSREKKFYHYEQLPKQLIEIYDPFTDSGINAFTLSSSELLDFYFKRLVEHHQLQFPAGKTIPPLVQEELDVIAKKQAEFAHYMSSRYSELKQIQTDLILDFSANDELNRTLKPIEGYKNLGDRFLKELPISQQGLRYPMKLLVTTKGLYLAYLVNLNPNHQHQLMVNEDGQLQRISLHDDFEMPVSLNDLVDSLIRRSEQFNYQIGLHTDLFIQKRLSIQPIILLAANNQVVGELNELKIISISDFKKELGKSESRVTKEQLLELIELIYQISEIEFSEEVFDYEKELSHNIEVYLQYFYQIEALLSGFKHLQHELEVKYRNH